MNVKRNFPNSRLRRLRASDNLIKLVSETSLSSNDLIQPLFIKENLEGTEPIGSMPNILRFSADSVLSEVEDVLNSGVNSIALFPVIEESKKDDLGKEALNKSNLICKSIQSIKKRFPEIIIIADVALDPYTKHGHDGIIKNNDVDNDLTLDVLKSQSLLLAESGADIIAPSDMMDGRIGVIRNALEEANFKNTILLSYAAKYNSKFYGPFRDAVKSSTNLSGKNKDTYQINVANFKEAFLESYIDIQEGADFLMVKPGMPYLDVLFNLTQKVFLPVFAYQVSGEYAMLKNAVNNGILSEAVILESLISFKRAGARGILSYFALEIAKKISS